MRQRAQRAKQRLVFGALEQLEIRTLPVVCICWGAGGIIGSTRLDAAVLRLSNEAGQLRINGAVPDSGAIACNDVREIHIRGEAGDELFDLTDVESNLFPRLLRVLVHGGDGIDSLKTSTETHHWTITGADRGHVQGDTAAQPWIEFQGVENLVGSALDDDFAFVGGGCLSGVLDGGAGQDSISFRDTVGQVAAELRGVSIQGFEGEMPGKITSFQGIDRLEGGPSSDRLVGVDAPAVWDLALEHMYSAAGRTLAFDGFEDLIGGSAPDEFLMQGDSLGILNLNVDGGEGDDRFMFGPVSLLIGKLIGGAGEDILDFSRYEQAVSVLLIESDATGYGGQEATALNGDLGFEGIDRIIGTAGWTGRDELQGINQAAIWNLNVISSYSILSSPGLVFADFEQLRGGEADDAFDIAADLAVQLAGGLGNDEFRFLVETSLVRGSVDGGPGVDLISCETLSHGVMIDLAENKASVITGEMHGLEHAVGSSGSDLLISGFADTSLAGSAGADRYIVLTQGAGVLRLEDAEGEDRLDFSRSSTGIELDLDLAGVQEIAPDLQLDLRGTFEHCTGSMLVDTVKVRPLASERQIDGGGPVHNIGDRLILDAMERTVSRVADRLLVEGYGSVRVAGFEDLRYVRWFDARPKVDLSIRFEAAALVHAGEPFLCVIEVVNHGPSTAHAVKVMAMTGAGEVPPGRAFFQEIPTLAAGERLRLDWEMRPGNPGLIRFHGFVSTADLDENRANNQALGEAEVRGNTTPGPHVVSVRRSRGKGRDRTLTIEFSHAMDPATVMDPRNYLLEQMPRRIHAKGPLGARQIEVHAVDYDPETRCATLHSKRRIGLMSRLRLTLDGPSAPGLYDNQGNRIQDRPLIVAVPERRPQAG